MAYPRDTSLKTQFPQLETQGMHRLIECMGICRACAKKCIEEGNARLAFLCLDCSEICDLAIKLKSCESEYTHQVLGFCAQVCRQCANACSRNAQSYHSQECAEACRYCAEACAEMPSYHSS